VTRQKGNPDPSQHGSIKLTSQLIKGDQKTPDHIEYCLKFYGTPAQMISYCVSTEKDKSCGTEVINAIYLMCASLLEKIREASQLHSFIDRIND